MRATLAINGLSKVRQESEIDLVIRVQDNNLNKVQVRYWDTSFLRHSTCIDLFKRISDGLTGLDLAVQVQVSINKPSIN